MEGVSPDAYNMLGPFRTTFLASLQGEESG